MDSSLVISVISGALLLVLVLGLVFKDDFRRDVLGGEGEANLFGMISVKGGVIVILFALLVAGLLNPLLGSTSKHELTSFLVSLALTPDRPDEARNQIHAWRGQAETVEREGWLSPEGVVAYVQKLGPEDALSEELRSIADAGEGPWSPFTSSVPVQISVPGDAAIEPGTAHVCPGRLYDQEIRLASNHRSGPNVVRGQSSIRVRADGLMFEASNCREVVGFDVKLNCRDAVNLFSDAVLRCSPDNKPLWRGGAQLLAAHAVPIPAAD